MGAGMERNGVRMEIKREQGVLEEVDPAVIVRGDPLRSGRLLQARVRGFKSPFPVEASQFIHTPLAGYGMSVFGAAVAVGGGLGYLNCELLHISLFE